MAAQAFDGFEAEAAFVGDDRLRLLIARSQDATDLQQVVDLDLAAHRQARLATVPLPTWNRSLSPDAGRLVFNRTRPAAATVFDLAGGRQLADLRQPGARVRARFLADGRLAELVERPAGAELTLLDGDGRPVPGVPRFPLPAGTPGAWIVQADPDRLLALEPWQPGRSGFERRWWLVDLRQGRMRPLGPTSLQLLEPFPRLAAGTAPLFTDGTHLLRIDLATGERHVLGRARPLEATYRLLR
ncbi:MAG: hypothetical protein JOZ15_19335 [Acidobacteria bacterium]|nr:hypothetical protein [Acidobacteriota bacterium]